MERSSASLKQFVHRCKECPEPETIACVHCNGITLRLIHILDGSWSVEGPLLTGIEPFCSFDSLYAAVCDFADKSKRLNDPETVSVLRAALFELWAWEGQESEAG